VRALGCPTARSPHVFGWCGRRPGDLPVGHRLLSVAYGLSRN
jgi:hypothetical protein